jgi:hypothetical protein
MKNINDKLRPKFQNQLYEQFRGKLPTNIKSPLLPQLYVPLRRKLWTQLDPPLYNQLKNNI